LRLRLRLRLRLLRDLSRLLRLRLRLLLRHVVDCKHLDCITEAIHK
jgi:hypothetical protein